MLWRAGLVLGAVVLLGLTFVLGVLVGRQWAAPGPVAALAESEGRREPARRSALGDAAAVRPPGHADTLTFYQTLTAPPGPLPPPATARAGAAGRTESRPRSEAPAAAATPVASAGTPMIRPAGPAAAAPVPALAAARPAPPRGPALGGLPESSGPSTGGFTVQVGAFRSRDQADGLHRHLAGHGFPVQVVAVDGGDEGRPRYRVRVGAYPTRDAARRMAQRLQAEQGLAAYVLAP
jgi:cell division protein FtsN